MRIYLVGYMYSGKTTLGRMLAERLGYAFVDTDQLFELKYKITIPLFLQKYDETLFRKLEAQVLRSTEMMEDVVVATGGGTPCHEGGMEWIKSHGYSVYLKMDLEGVMARQAVSRHSRPLLAQMGEEERRQFVERQLAQRTPIYEQAIVTVDALRPNMESLVQMLRSV